MTEGRILSMQSIKALIVACLVLALNLALIAQSPQPQSTSDDSFSTTIVLQKKIYDDSSKAANADKSFDGDSSLVGITNNATFLPTLNAPQLCTSLYLAAEYLASSISPPSRAPPFINA